jgi:hypothetical protein
MDTLNIQFGYLGDQNHRLDMDATRHSLDIQATGNTGCISESPKRNSLDYIQVTGLLQS